MMKFLSTITDGIRRLQQGPDHGPRYRILSIEKDEDGQFMAEIQVVNKKQVFRIKPETVLADDTLTDGFHPRDIRTLTYLGYLGINGPKYKILAQRLCESDEKLEFALGKRGSRDTIVKKADEISDDHDLLNNLDQQDAHRVGYVRASEDASKEAAQKAALISKHSKKA